jgi:predicted glycosyltransferase
MTVSAPRLLFYSHNGVGVGHFRRQLRLASAFRDRREDAALLLVTGSHAASALSGPLGLDFVSLPSIQMVDRYENWKPRHPGLTIRKTMRMRAELLRRTVRRFRPDLLIADFMPAGPYGELVGALEELAAGGGRAVAGFRDIIDEPDFVRDLWSRTGVYEVLRQHYSAVCVYGAPEVMDFTAGYGLDEELGPPLHYTGYLGRVSASTADASGGSDARSGPTVLACTGGGVDGGALLECFVAAAQRVQADRGGSYHVVGGPLLPETELSRLRAQADGSGIEVTRFKADLDSWIVSSDLVVTMPGYNTSCELLSGAANAIVVPRAGPSQEQRLRASWLERWGRARALEPATLDPAGLAEAIASCLQHVPPPVAPVSLQGIGRAVTVFESLATGAATALVT